MRSQLKVLAVLIAAFAVAIGAALPALADSDAARLAGLHDQARGERGLASLARAGDLTADAQAHARRMAERGEIYHSGRASQLDGWYALGENVGWASTVEEVFDLFMESDSHRDNILYSSWDSMGVGVANGEGGEVYVAVLFGDRDETPRRQAQARPAAKRPRSTPPQRKRVPAPPTPAPSVRPTPIATPSASAQPDVATPAPVPVAATAPPEPQPSDASRALGVLLAVEREHVEPRPTEAAAIGDVSVSTAQRRFSESEAERRRQAHESEQGAAAHSLGGIARCAWFC